MTDQALKQAVLSALHVERLIDDARIVVAARDGVVTLSGEIDAYPQKMAAKFTAERVVGVKKVIAELKIRAPAKAVRGIEDLAAKVANALYWDCAVPPDRVSSRCEQGWVTLTGEVDRAYQRSSAEADVRKIRGVVGVTNEIKVGERAKGETARRGGAIVLGGPLPPAAEDRDANADWRASLS
jgi:osmotically-inducible protein OsmY